MSVKIVQLKNDPPSTAPITVDMDIDGQVYPRLSTTSTDWRLIGGLMRVGSGNMHTITVTVNFAKNNPSREAAVALDGLMCYDPSTQCQTPTASSQPTITFVA